MITFGADDCIMNNYSAIASFYDILTDNVDYGKVHRFYSQVFEEFGHHPHILLDLACGTGRLCFAFERDGIDVIGVDCSEYMLDVAYEGKIERGSNALFLQQPAHKLDLYGTVDTVVCNLDSVNHFAPKNIQKVFERVALFAESGSLFVFDVNSKYKFENLLNDACYCSDCGDMFCVWTSTFDGKKADIRMDVFERAGELYKRREDSVVEYYYSDEYISDLLNRCGFDLLGKYADFCPTPPSQNSQRIHYIAKRRGSTWENS